MSKNLNYWYSGVGQGSHVSELPPQALPSTKKDDLWKKSTMDALERIGIVQLKDNLKYRDFYRMVEGKMSYSELSEVIPQLREVGEMLDDLDIPTFLKHYDLIGIIINAMIGEYVQNTDKFNVTNVDEISTNEYERTKKELVTNYIQEEFKKELDKRLIERGLNPDVEGMEFNNEEEQQAYLQQLQQQQQELTPPEIQKFMDTTWRTKATIWGEHTLEADKEYHKLDKLDRLQLKDFLLTGRCFRHFRVGYDYYEPETWSPLNTFFSAEVDTRYVEDGEYVGRVHYYSPSKVVNKYGHLLSKKAKEKILGNYHYKYNDGGNEHLNFGDSLKSNFGKTQITPHSQYHDHNFMVGIQEEFGLPVGQKTILNKQGEEEVIPSFLPNYGRDNTNSNYLAQFLRDDLPLRSDLIQVTEAYWISYKKIGYLNYTTDTGRLAQQIVTDDILADFLKDMDIKQLTNVTLEESENNPKPNTIVWDYVPETWKGVKINEGNGYLDEAIYLDIKPTEFQVRGNSNVYDVKLPVVGLIDKSLALKMQPFQVGYNVVMNQLYNLLEKEIGLFFIFDVNFLPSEFKEWGNTEETLVHLRNLTKDVGLFPIDASKQNVGNGGGFNQFAPQNLSFSGQIADRMQLSEFYKNKAYEQIGFNPQRLGTAVKYETAEGVRQSQTASFAQTEIYFETFSEFKQNALEMHLNVAQYAQKNDKDIKVFYTKSDSTKAYLKFADPFFQLRKIGLMPVSNSKKRKELESFKQYLMNTNTLGGDEMAIAKLFTSDTMVELIEVARAERIKREQDIQAQRSHESELIAKKAEADDAIAIKKWEREEITHQRDRENKIQIEKIESLGRAVDNEADQSKIDFIVNQADMAIKKEKNDGELSIKQAEQVRKNNKDQQDFKLKMLQLKNETLKIQANINKTKNDKYIAEINKN